MLTAASKSLLICDLDGTLVDSHAGITEALQYVCSAAGIVPRVTLEHSVAGPPLHELLRTVTGVDDDVELERLAGMFVSYYDQYSCLTSTPFEGIREMLRAIMDAGHILSIATNKRMRPTQRIINELGWANLFRSVEAVDSRPVRRSKAAMLVDILRDIGSTKANTWYIGDGAVDVIAAREAGVRFVFAGWGGGDRLEVPAQITAASPSEVLSRIAIDPATYQ